MLAVMPLSLDAEPVPFAFTRGYQGIEAPLIDEVADVRQHPLRRLPAEPKPTPAPPDGPRDRQYRWSSTAVGAQASHTLAYPQIMSSLPIPR